MALENLETLGIMISHGMSIYPWLDLLISPWFSGQSSHFLRGTELNFPWGWVMWATEDLNTLTHPSVGKKHPWTVSVKTQAMFCVAPGRTPLTVGWFARWTGVIVGQFGSCIFLNSWHHFLETHSCLKLELVKHGNILPCLCLRFCLGCVNRAPSKSSGWWFLGIPRSKTRPNILMVG